MLVCSACSATEIKDSKCQKCGAWVTSDASWGTTGLDSDPTERKITAPSDRAQLLKPSPEPPGSIGAFAGQDFTEEATDVGEVYPRLSTSAIMGEPVESGPNDEIVNLTESMAPKQKAVVPSAESPDKCGSCGAAMNLDKSRFCDACGVRAPKRVNTARRSSARPRTASKIILRCKLCGYNVPAGSPSCRNCGTPLT